MRHSTTHGWRRGVALAAIIMGLAAPAASAAPIEPVGSNPDNQKLAEAYSVPPLEFPSSPAPAPGANDGFDWGVAGIGATASYPNAWCDVPEVAAKLPESDRNMPGARRVAESIVTLPTHAYCPPDLPTRVGQILRPMH